MRLLAAIHAALAGRTAPKILGIGNSQVYQWRRRGVRLDIADRIAIRLGAGTEASA